MDDELLGARVGATLRELYPEPQSVHLTADRTRGRRGHRLAWAVAAAAIIVALAVGLSVFAASRDPGTRPAAGDLRIQNHRLVAPFSMDAGVIQLTPAPAGYQARISYERAQQLIFAGAGGQGHAVFLATLAVYPSPGGAPSPADEQVWASAVRGVPQVVFGPPKPGQPINHDYVDVLAVDARTGRDVQQILIGKPDPVASSIAPR